MSTDASEQALTLFADYFAATPLLQPLIPDLLRAWQAAVTCYESGGKILLCGNGGSFSDACHIAGELIKSFEAARSITAAQAAALADLPYGEILTRELEQGLPALALGLNGALATAVINDKGDQRTFFAQEVMAFGKPGDILIGISTSGNAVDVLMAMSVAKMRGLTTITLTGADGGQMATGADIPLRAPGTTTARVQEAHIQLYHALCLSIEKHFFPEARGYTSEGHNL